NVVPFKSNPTELIQAVNSAGAYQGDPYKTSGGTNGTGGLYRASQLLANAPRTTNQLGREWIYRRAIIFVTDGVTNVFFDASNPNLKGGSSKSFTYPQGHVCRKAEVLEDALCQTTEVGGKYKGMDRPITQMVNMANTIKSNQSIQTDIYVLALSSIPATGLRDGVASTPRHFYTAETLEPGPDGLNNVDRIMLAINAEIKRGSCMRGSDGEWRATIPGDHFRSVNGLSYPNVGEVILQDPTTNSVYRAPIVAGTDGRLRYTFEEIPRGTYRMQAYLFYRHPLDPPTAGPRMYGQIVSNSSIQSDVVVVLDPTERVGFISTIEENLRLRLSGDVCSMR
ncbi:MAG: VWA domain-containing protein, partial [Chloroflexi bacterium]